MIAAPAKKLKDTRARAIRAEIVPPKPQPIAERTKNKGETNRIMQGGHKKTMGTHQKKQGETNRIMRGMH